MMARRRRVWRGRERLFIGCIMGSVGGTGPVRTGEWR